MSALLTLFAFYYSNTEQTNLSQRPIIQLGSTTGVILHRKHYKVWLAGPDLEAKNLADLLVPYEAELMKRYEVSPLVNRPQNDVPECAEQVRSAFLDLSLPIKPSII